jgi:hypothetical protein
MDNTNQLVGARKGFEIKKIDTLLKNSYECSINPSIFNDCGVLLLNIRLYHYQPNKMVTRNLLAVLDNDFNIKKENIINILPYTPISKKYIGLEDARLIKWNDTIYLCGSKKDEVNEDIEVIQIVTLDNHNEISKLNLHFSNDREKNWMPVADLPNHFVRWTAPFQLLKNNKIVFEKYDELPKPYRGSSQVIRYVNKRMCVIHEVENEYDLYRKEYFHRIIVWDLNWNVINITDRFKFLGNRIEFCCGLTIQNDNFIFSVGIDDIESYIIVNHPIINYIK